LGEIDKQKFDELSQVYKLFIKKIHLVYEITKNRVPNEIKNFKLIKIIPVFKQSIIKKILTSINISETRIYWDIYVVNISPMEYKMLFNQYPFLIGNINDQSQSFSENLLDLHSIDDSIILDEPNPNVVIGVIDSGLDLPSNFDKYIEYEDHRELGKGSDKSHGSSVTSLLIANDKLNPGDNDNFGQFNVKHFEVLEILDKSGKAKVNTNYLYKKINNIVSNNKEIKI